MEKTNKKIMIIGVIIGIALIILGLVTECIRLNNALNISDKEVKKLKIDIEEMALKYEDERNERIRLELINNDLWELYYTQVSDYKGEHEYYE